MFTRGYLVFWMLTLRDAPMVDSRNLADGVAGGQWTASLGAKNLEATRGRKGPDPDQEPLR